MKEITRRGFIAATGAMVLALAGCGGESGNGGPSPTSSTSGTQPSATASTSEPSPLEIVESGYSVSDAGYVMYGIGIKNPNENKQADLPSFTITGKADDGSIVFSDGQTLIAIAPGETVYYGFQAGNGTAPSTVEFVMGDCDFSDAEKPDGAIFTLSNVSEVPGSYGMSSYTGELTLNHDFSDYPNQSLLNQTCVSVILRDASGAIVYGMSTYVDTPDTGATVPFEVSAYNVPEHASYELYAQIW